MPLLGADEATQSWVACLGRVLLVALMTLLNVLQFAINALALIGRVIVDELSATERMFMLTTNLYAFMCQFFFFSLCEVALLPAKRSRSSSALSTLTTLLLYSILTYFLSRVRRSLRRHRSLGVRTHVLRAFDVMLELAKAAIIVVCLQEQGLQVRFDARYTPITFAYYACTERLFVDGLVAASKRLALAALDGLEHLYVPIALHVVGVLLAAGVLATVTTSRRHVLHGCLTAYFTVYLPVKDVLANYLTPLIVEQRTFASFRTASAKELRQLDDVCAVCLERMSRARVTPCRHFFHPQCLKRCLQTSMLCPLCKHDFLVSLERRGG